MKIGFLTSEYPHPSFGNSGGIGTSIKSLAISLINLGHQVTIILYGQKKDDSVTVDGIHFITVKNPKLKGLSWLLLRLKLQKIINKEIETGNIEVLEVSDWTGISAFMNLKCPVAMRLHGTDTVFCYLDNRKVKSWNKYLEGNALKKADGIIAVSDFIGKQTNLVFKHNFSYTVIYNGINPSEFPQTNNTSQNKVILYFGTLIRKKGVLEIPYIFNEVYTQSPNSKLILIGYDAPDIKTGSTSTWELMKPMFNKSSFENISYLGKISHSEMSDYIQNATVCIFPSYAEAFPISWLEAMCMGKALATSNIGWSNEIIKDQVNGLMESPSNHKAFAANILKLLNQPVLNQMIGNNAQETIISKFTAFHTATQTVQFYSSLLKR